MHDLLLLIISRKTRASKHACNFFFPLHPQSQLGNPLVVIVGAAALPRRTLRKDCVNLCVNSGPAKHPSAF